MLVIVPLMDAWTIADALMVGRDLPAAKLRRLVMRGDDGDRLYAWLFQVIRGQKTVLHLEEATANACAHQPTSAVWSHLMRYAHAPGSITYSAIVRAAHDGDGTSWDLLRLAPLVLSGRHRRDFVGVVKEAVRILPKMREEMEEVTRELRMRGPARLYAKRAAMTRSRSASVR